MDVQTIAILLALGLATGLLSGLVGVGGGIILVPALVYFVGYSQLDAQGTSLALLMLPVGFLGVIQYYKNGHIDMNTVLILAAGFILGSLFGSKIALQLPQETVRKVFALLMIVIAIKLLFFQKK
jgi:hypothetical protein